jgi:hypothetical protein
MVLGARRRRPEHSLVPDERKDPFLISAAGVEALGPVHPALKDFVDGGVEVFHPDPDLGCERAQQHRRQGQSGPRGGRNQDGGN